MAYHADYNPITQFNAGSMISDSSVEMVKDEIMRILNMNPEEYEQICDNAMKAAEHYDFKNLTNELIGIIESV